MKAIKFSHRYLKMKDGFEQSILLAVLPVKLEDLGLDFLLYDTSYMEGMEEKQYPLPAKGDYLILVLQAGSGRGQIFTTIRRRTPEKEAYYRGLIGEVLECKITS